MREGFKGFTGKFKFRHLRGVDGLELSQLTHPQGLSVLYPF